MLKKAFSISTFAIASHSAAIYYHKYNRHQYVARTSAIPAPADDQLSDHLQTGDLLVMRRKWHLQYLPVAFNILIYRYLFQSECDHVGVILTDNMGKAFVIERSALWGHNITPYHDRIAHSEAELIVLLPLRQREANIWAQTLLELQKDGVVSFSSELIAYPLNFLFYNFFDMLCFLSMTKKRLECPNISFIKRVFHLLNVETHFLLPHESSDGDRLLSIETLTNKKIAFKHKGNYLVLSNEDVLIRTR